MPTARGREGHLRPAVLHFVVCGQLPPPDGDRDGLIEAFNLRYTPLPRTDYLAQLRALWMCHRAEIVEAANSAEPWIARVLANPACLDENETDEKTDHDERGKER